MRSRIAACRSETGYVIIAVLTVLVVITTAAGLGLHRLAGLRTSHAARARVAAAFQLAEAGVAKAQWELSQPGSQYAGETQFAFAGGTLDIRVSEDKEQRGYRVECTSRVERGSGVPSRCMVRARLSRDASGALKLVSWSQVRPTQSVLSGAGAPGAIKEKR